MGTAEEDAVGVDVFRKPTALPWEDPRQRRGLSQFPIELNIQIFFSDLKFLQIVGVLNSEGKMNATFRPRARFKYREIWTSQTSENQM